jgi:hypothetical protein
MISKTPRSDKLEETRISFGEPRTAAYGDALALCRELERELRKYQEDAEQNPGSSLQLAEWTVKNG